MKRYLRKLFEYFDACFDAAFEPAANPMLQLGAMGWFFYWIVIASGIYLYIFFDTGVTDAWQSLEYITYQQWYAGGIMRSLHRYASDALVIVVILHLLREFALDRLHGARYFSWITGVVLLWFLYASGISGYWIVWDKLAQYIAIATTEWLDTLPFFGEPIARNFLNESTLSGRFFTLFVFIHIAVPLIMLFLMWIHIQRISLPKVNPPKKLAVGSLIMLLILSLIKPAISHGPANLNEVPSVIGLDWFYLFIYPLLDHYSGLFLWAVLLSGTIFLLLLPWLPAGRKEEYARVDLANCNSCNRCVLDCPYSAVSMQPRTDGLPYPQQAVVNPDLCVSCGICAGACPTATPFRRKTSLVPGIQLPEYPIAELKNKILVAAEELNGNSRVIVFGCEPGPELTVAGLSDTAAIRIPCTGMLPPPFIDFIISRHYADGVFITGCREGGCYHRLGNNWTQQRIDRKRDPLLRQRIDRDRVAVCWLGLQGEARMQDEIVRFKRLLEKISAKDVLLDKPGSSWPN